MRMQMRARVYVAGHRGLVGSALGRALGRAGYRDVVVADRAKLDLMDPAAVSAFFARERPDFVFLAAALVGGIAANVARPADFIYQNLAIQTSVINAAREHGVRRLLFFGSACAYPVEAAQPMAEDLLLKGRVEPTNEPFAVAKLAGMSMCGAYNRQYGTQFFSVIPASVFGPHDKFDLEGSHILAALLRKAHEARGTGRPLIVWGTGSPLREFIYVDDLADGCLHLMECEDEFLAPILGSPWPAINVGTGNEISVRDLAELVRSVVGLEGPIEFDRSRPDGAPRKVLDSSRMRALGWVPRTTLRDGVKYTYDYFVGATGKP